MTTQSNSRPNIIVCLVDDLGFSDIGCYGSEIRTPNLDRMGNSGLRFTQMYNAARCCPSRAALLTACTRIRRAWDTWCRITVARVTKATSTTAASRSRKF